MKYGARRLTMILPYYGYSTMERAVRPGEGMRILDRYMACFGSNTYCDLPTGVQPKS